MICIKMKTGVGNEHQWCTYQDKALTCQWQGTHVLQYLFWHIDGTFLAHYDSDHLQHLWIIASTILSVC